MSTQGHFMKGKSYKRKNIMEAVGGGPGYLPMKGDEVVCGLFSPAENAVTHLGGEIDVYPKLLSKGAKSLDSHRSIPVFLQFANQDWRYVGEYRLDNVDHSKKAI